MWSRSRGCLKSDRGSVLVESLLVSVLLVALTLGIIQLALFLHVRNTLHDAAIEGARRASLIGETPSSGVALTRGLIATAVGESFAREVTARAHHMGGIPSVVVTVSAPLPVIGIWGPRGWLTVEGQAPLETLGGVR